MKSSFSSSRLGGCRLLQHKIESKQKELQMEVKCVVDELGKVLQFVELVLKRGEELVLSMKSDKTKFSFCSQGLARLDDQVTILRSFVGQLQSGEIKTEQEEEKSFLGFSDLHSRMQKRFAELEEDAKMLVSQVQAFSLQLDSQVQRVVERATLALEESNLMESFKMVSNQLTEAEVEVFKGWQVIQECQEVLQHGLWKDEAEFRISGIGKENQHNVNGVVPLDTASKCGNSLSSKHNLNASIQSIKPAKVKRVIKSKVVSEPDSISRLNHSLGPPLDCSTPLTSVKDLPPSGKISPIATSSHPPLIPNHCQNTVPMYSSNHPSARLSLPRAALSSASARFQALPESSTSSAAEKRQQDILNHRKQELEKLRKEFGQWGRPLNPNTEYFESRVYFQEGHPKAFWLSIDTQAKVKMQEKIQAMVEEPSKVQIQSLVVGGLILARYSDDGNVYRARVVKVVDNTVTVRYIDYGNAEEGLLQSSLYTWDPALEVIPAQALLCCFSLPDGAKFSGALDDNEMQKFREVMQGEHLRVVVKRRLQENNHLMLQHSDIDAPELEVSLYTKRGTDLILKLRKHKLQSTKQQPIKQRPLLKPPPPLHLTGEEAIPWVEQEGPTTPLAANLLSRAVDNVIWWFEHKFSDEATYE